MKRYDFWAVAYDDGEGNRIRDRHRLEAGSFEEACEIASERHQADIAEYGYEPEVYTEFELIGEVDV